MDNLSNLAHRNDIEQRILHLETKLQHLPTTKQLLNDTVGESDFPLRRICVQKETYVEP